MNVNIKAARSWLGSLAIVCFACAGPWLKADSLTQVTIDTSTLAGQTENLVFDFDLGGGTQTNTVLITNFYTDGTLSPIYQASNAGVTGSLPGNLTFTSGQTVVEELYVTEVLGNTITFDFDSTNNAPTAGAFPDEFDVYLLDPTSSQTVLPSSDPSGAGSLLAIDLYGGAGPTFTNFSLDGGLTLGAPSLAPAPEPAGLLLLGLVLLGVGSPWTRTRLLRLLRRSAAGGLFAALYLACALVPTLRAQSPVTNVGVDSNVTVTFSGLRFIHATNQYVSVATITNVGYISQTIPGPFYLGITGAGGPAYLVNPSGQMPDGSSGVEITTPAMLAPGQSATFNVLFTDPGTKTFTIAAKVWDAASNPPPATLQCPQGVTAPGFPGAAPVSSYTAPTDSVGRVATCIPTPGTALSTYNPTGTCSAVSAYYPAASCTFPITTPNIAPSPVLTLGTITLGGPEQTDLRLAPCSAIAGSFSPAFINSFLSAALPLYNACGSEGAGVTAFSIYNYGPNPAYNFSVTMKFPPGPSRAAWRFSQANSCAPPVPQTFSEETPSGPELVENGGEDVTCTFAELDPYQSMDGILGLDLPSGTNTNNVPAIEVDVALDPTQNFTTDTSDLSALVTVSSGPVGPITVPASISEKSQPCDYSSSPGFAILLNLCDVPPIVTEVLVGTFLGAATVLTGGAAVALDVTEIGSSVIFDANQGAALILTR